MPAAARSIKVWCTTGHVDAVGAANDDRRFWPIPAPQSWISADTANAYRACVLCDHMATASESPGAQHCNCPAIRGRGAAVPVAQARAQHGPCGPEAVHMSAAWLKN